MPRPFCSLPCQCLDSGPSNGAGSEEEKAQFSEDQIEAQDPAHTIEKNLAATLEEPSSSGSEHSESDEEIRVAIELAFTAWQQAREAKSDFHEMLLAKGHAEEQIEAYMQTSFPTAQHPLHQHPHWLKLERKLS